MISLATMMMAMQKSIILNDPFVQSRLTIVTLVHILTPFHLVKLQTAVDVLGLPLPWKRTFKPWMGFTIA